MQPKTTKIPVQDLRPGMYVEAVDRPWLETDFLLEGFRIENKADIDRLSAVARFVYVSASDVPESDARPAQTDSDAVPRAWANDREPRTFGRELRRSRAIRNKAKLVVETAHEEIRAGRAVDTQSARQVVEQMMASVARHPDALVWFSNLKDRDAYTAEHSMNVCMLAVSLATHVGESEQRICEMGVGALLHDVGKIKVPTAVLNKPGKLTDEEFAEMKRHPKYGVEILEAGSTNLSRKSLEVVLSHHERLNGTGYPRGLVGNQISHYSQLVSIADVYDAITSDRVYQDGRSPAAAIAVMRAGEGEFNTDLLNKFAESLGAYPVGTMVELDTGEVGFVVPTEEKTDRPTILLVLDRNKRRYHPQRLRDLRKFSGFEIVSLLALGDYGVNVDDYADWLE